MTDNVFQIEILDSGKDLFDYLVLISDGIVAPILALVFGYWILKATKRLEHSQWRNQKLIEKRIDIWDEVGPILNDIYCYFMRVGSWKAFSPEQIIEKKREVDKLIYLAEPYFSKEIFAKYNRLITTCFETNQGHGLDAKLKTTSALYNDVHDKWENGWDEKFIQSPLDEALLKKSYVQLIAQVRSELNRTE